MSELPIIFNTEMVRAILEGRKTQTRRPIKHSLICNADTDKLDSSYVYVQDEYGDNHHILTYSPYQIGDKLYVRETFATGYAIGGIDGNQNVISEIYKASTKPSDVGDLNWKPSIHMPKEYARIWLEVTNIRVERVQDITEDDVWKEGLNKEEYYDWLEDASCIGVPAGTTYEKPKDLYSYLWNSIYKNWEENPFVWVIEFKVLTIKGEIK